MSGLTVAGKAADVVAGSSAFCAGASLLGILSFMVMSVTGIFEAVASGILISSCILVGVFVFSMVMLFAFSGISSRIKERVAQQESMNCLEMDSRQPVEGINI